MRLQNLFSFRIEPFHVRFPFRYLLVAMRLEIMLLKNTLSLVSTKGTKYT